MMLTCPRCDSEKMESVTAHPDIVAYAICGLCGNRFDIADEPGKVGELSSKIEPVLRVQVVTEKGTLTVVANSDSPMKSVHEFNVAMGQAHSELAAQLREELGK